MYYVKYSKIIDDDIDSCYFYIKEKLEAPRAAENLMEELYNKKNEIKESPYKRPLVQDSYLASEGIRSIKVKNYVLYYNVDEDKKCINAIRFLYNKRNWKNLLKEKSIEELMG
ncbi:MAG: type II toxin-antitoxin system RelE/ParE family toxin [Treponema sp.]|jgi:addiction module RelE/StbE family toxin|nr:type II toxin-antitoxin system RelE/ParE family toxin [Treponema sp.]